MQGMVIGEEHPQVSARSTRSGRDQHGRIWRAIIDNKTGHPVSPPTPGFRAPVIPPEKYVRPDVSGRHNDLGDYTIDYDQWETDLVDAWGNYNRRVEDVAHSQYQDDPEKALRDRPRKLMSAVGGAPQDPRIPRACKAGNKWILGLSPLKPDWAKELFPDAVPGIEQFPDAEEFPDVDDGTEPLGAAGGDFPRHLGGGNWELSNRTKMKGTREAAEAAQSALAEFADA